MSYSDVTDVLEQKGISWNDIDRIFLNEDAYDEFHEMDVESSNYSTNNVPAVRHTTGQEKIVYIDNKGYLQETEL